MCQNVPVRRRIALSAGILVLAAACSGKRTDTATYPGAPIVLISVDTLRSDHLPAYGYAKVDTPAIDALRRDSILFRRAYSHVPLTLPSHVSILTGLLPGESGVRDNLGYRLQSDRVPYLPKILKGLGYKTGGFASAYVLRAETGLADGFDVYDASIEVLTDEPLGWSQRPGKDTLAKALDWLRGVGREPYFLFFHIYEPHTPYEPPEPFASRYADKYDGEIAASDAIIGELLDVLRKRGDYERAIVVFLSDHGEGLGDHGEPEHGIFLYREAIQVPLIVKLPEEYRHGETVDAPAQLTDVLPTLVGLAGGHAPAPDHGASLLALGSTARSRHIFAETMYARLHYGWSDLASVIDDRWQLIHGPDPELFDVVADPAERRNLRASALRIGNALDGEATALRKPLEAPQEENDETRARLESLGYVGSAAPTAGESLPDPKSKLPDLRLHGAAFSHFFHRDYAKSVELFRDLLRDNPLMLDAWEHLGLALEKLGRNDEARTALAKAMELSSGRPQIALAMSRILFKLGDLDAAEKHAILGIPSSATLAHSLLAQIALQRKDLVRAESEAREALAARGSKVGALMTLAQVQAKQQRLPEALATCDAAIASLNAGRSGEGFQGLQMVRGDILARMQRSDEAIAAFREEIRLFPWDVVAYSRLAVVYHVEGRDREASETVSSMCLSNPSATCYAEAVRTLRVIGEDRAAAVLLDRARKRFPGARELAGAS